MDFIPRVYFLFHDPHSPVGCTDENYSVLENISSTLQYSSWKEIDLPFLKGLMLQIASNIIQPITEDFLASIQRGSRGGHRWSYFTASFSVLEDLNTLKMTSSEVVSVSCGLLVQSRNCRLRHCNRSGARLALFACRLMKDYSSEAFPYDASSARIFGNLNIFSHMKSNQEMVNCLLDEISVGNTLGKEFVLNV